MIDVIVNPTAGNGYALKVIEQVEKHLKENNIAHKIYYTEYKKHATELAKQSVINNVDTVLCVGGDGTAFEIVSGLTGSKTALGLIPAGTGNDFIKTIKTPKDPIEALKRILSTKPRPLDLGQANDNMFLNVSGTGFDVMVLDFAEKAKKFVKGILPYLYGIIQTIIHHKPYKLKITLDNEKVIEGNYLICAVCNGRYFGGGIKIAGNAEVNDGLFDVIIVEDIKKSQMPKYLLGLLKGKILEFDITKAFYAKTVKIESKGMRVNEDGEIFKTDVVEFKNLHNNLNVYW
ncbi:MAG: diacylglycerol kinase family lipid kinase [Christensenellaceae bacterium]|nr:diacylglycerol kinase family lipid kinase [Christensenellaceae bacterium]